MKDIANKTYQLLKDHDLFKAPIDIKALIKKLKIKLDPLDLGDDISGLLVSNQGDSKIGFNKNESSVRQRFTLAHELGHYILHVSDNNKVFLDNVKVMYRKHYTNRIEKSQEIQANIFAASILMPEILVEKEFKSLLKGNAYLSDDEIIKDLSKKFKVSQTAMNYRLINLRLLEQYY